ncbi:MAG: TlyA family rRNA (cytidine-2'-O)-methyltransferase [Clostridiales bacterium 38-18]|nr:MAG: TlyA family rRNA (cytidine-2'-O)-methyltransferase [Clostridiales bacterium 38-18]
MSKERIDVLLVEQGLIETRERAQKAIMAGLVFIGTERIDKPGTKVDTASEITLKGNPIPYVSRGGLKLEKAIKTLNIDLSGKRCMDIGASTGGFTDCMLQNGADHVFSVDVGYGQLDWKLRNDERVTNMERTNIRYVTEAQIGEKIDFLSIDVSFISLKLVLPVAKQLLKEDGSMVFLIKPQFEAGRDQVKKSGVIRDLKVHKQVLESIMHFCKENEIFVSYLTFSPIKGPKGNIEFLAYATLITDNTDLMIDTDKVAQSAHESLIAE